MPILRDAIELLGQYGYPIVFLGVLLENAGAPLPGETVLLVAGALAHQGALDPGVTVLFGALGAAAGGQIGYWTGRRGGRPFVLRWGRYLLVTPERLSAVERFIERHGGKAVFFARFFVGLRVLGALVAGIGRMPWVSFSLYNTLGGTVWAAAVVLAGYLLWASLGRVEHWLGRTSLLLLAALALVLLVRHSYRRLMRPKKREHR